MRDRLDRVGYQDCNAAATMMISSQVITFVSLHGME
ncbi:hypothetical protein M2171_007775 [Bradyrhizobium japonicum USDA 38]|nr:hypothetical protein [Bradyrhizobium japonicum USDA 38]MCS3941695.1 hypothetical protein [Bradyrhizobium japonicum]MCW2225818.1 hypothetical protein [Bradyrhizobium japonicum]MCW2341029.1 hypothetical protein [Bradyrhizobium japonicum]